MRARPCCRRPPRRPARARRSTRYAADYPAGPHDQPQTHVPGLRLAARRPAHAPHGDGPLGLGLLRLRPDLHLALLRRAPHRRLRAVQFRDAGHRQAVRGHPRGGATSSPTRELYDAVVDHQPLRADRIAACRCSCCRRRSTACASSASTCRASACRRMRKPRTCWPARCCVCAHRGRAGPGAGAARRRAANGRPSRCSARCSRPIRWASA